jgi:hypothetical protein
MGVCSSEPAEISAVALANTADEERHGLLRLRGCSRAQTRDATPPNNANQNLVLMQLLPNRDGRVTGGRDEFSTRAKEEPVADYR